jgi:hypothetical protein
MDMDDGPSRAEQEELAAGSAGHFSRECFKTAAPARLTQRERFESLLWFWDSELEEFHVLLLVRCSLDQRHAVRIQVSLVAARGQKVQAFHSERKDREILLTVPDWIGAAVHSFLQWTVDMDTPSETHTGSR